MTGFSSFLIQPSTTCLGSGVTHSGFDPPVWIHNQDTDLDNPPAEAPFWVRVTGGRAGEEARSGSCPLHLHRPEDWNVDP